MSLRCAVLLLLLLPSVAAAQDRAGPTFGLGLGAGWGPGVLDKQCGRPGPDVYSQAMVAEARASVRLRGRLRLEGRLAQHAILSGYSCVGLTLPREGLYTFTRYRSGESTFGGEDLRLRYDAPGSPGALTLVFTGGGGWLRHVQAPYVAVGPGVRVGTLVRLALDGDLLLARLPYDVVVEEWRADRLVREVSRRTNHQWRRFAGARVGIELATR